MDIHGPDKSAPEGSNARNGDIVRVQVGKWFESSDGVFYHEKKVRSEDAISNATHMPLKFAK